MSSPAFEAESGAECSPARRVVQRFLADLSAVAAGEKSSYLEHCHPDVVFTVTGQTPLSGTYRGVAEVVERFRSRATVVMGRRPGYGLIATQFIEEGEEIVVLARGRGGNVLEQPYNNSYFLYFRVSDGRIVHYIEDFDSSLAWRAIFKCHLE